MPDGLVDQDAALGLSRERARSAGFTAASFSPAFA